MRAAPHQTLIEIRELRPGDLEDVVRIDALHTEAAKPAYWRQVLQDFLEPGSDKPRIGLVADQDQRLVGYLLGEVRAFESATSGWVFAVGVDPPHLHTGVASALLDEACRRFGELGVRRVRTMVERDNLNLLGFFRANDFVGGTVVHLERDIEATE